MNSVCCSNVLLCGRVSSEPGQAPGFHSPDPGSREGSVQGPEDPQRHPQVRSDLSRLFSGPDYSQEQGQGKSRTPADTPGR